MMPNKMTKNAVDASANSTTDAPLSPLRARYRLPNLTIPYCATRCVAVLVSAVELGTPGNAPKIVVNVFVVVTVTVMTRCLLGQAVASAVVQSFALGDVEENAPASVAH